MKVKNIFHVSFLICSTLPIISIAEDSPVNVQSWEIGAVVEVEAMTTDSDEYSENSASDIVVATVELAIGAQLNEFSRADVSFLYEEDDTDLEVDVATLTFGKDDSGLQLTLGQDYLPFGLFETGLVNDTLVLELAETRETAAILAYRIAGVSLGTFAFRGDADDSSVAEFGAVVDFETEHVKVGASYIGNLLDSDGISGVIEDDFDGFDVEEDDLGNITGFGRDFNLAAADIYFGLSIGGASVLVEYLETESVDSDLAAAGFGVVDESISAMQIEFDYISVINEKEVVWAAAYQKTEEALFLGLPETRVSLGAGVAVTDNISVGTELGLDQDYDYDPDLDAGPDESATSIVVQVAVHF